MTVKPLNDSAYEGDETIDLNLADNPYGGAGGAYLLAATQPATTNPASKPATARAVQKGLNVTVVQPKADPNAPQPSTLEGKITQLGDTDQSVRDAAEADLVNTLGQHPSLEGFFRERHAAEEDPEVKTRLGRVIQTVNVFVTRQAADSNTLQITLNLPPPPAGDKYIVEVRLDDFPDGVALKPWPGQIDVFPGNQIFLPPGEVGVPPLEVVTRRAGEVILEVTVKRLHGAEVVRRKFSVTLAGT